MATANVTRRVIACRASPDYRLWVRFTDGVEGHVFLGNLLEIGAFQAWRNLRLFLTARVDPETATVVWPDGGVRLAPDVLYQDLVSRGAKPLRPALDKKFRVFMTSALKPVSDLGGDDGTR